jgi:hypothetical protein
MLHLRDETTGENLIVSASDCCNLNNNTNNEYASRAQNTVLPREDLGHEARKESSEPGSKLQDSSKPSLLCRVVNVAVRLYYVSKLDLHKMRLLNLRFPNEGMAKMPLNMPWL